MDARFFPALNRNAMGLSDYRPISSIVEAGDFLCVLTETGLNLFDRRRQRFYALDKILNTASWLLFTGSTCPYRHFPTKIQAT